MPRRVAKRDRRRDLITETTSAISCGSLGFEVAQARLAGWTEEEINRFWLQITPFYDRIQRKMQKRYPDRYHTCKDGTVIYIGPDENGHSMDRRKLRGL